jgi:hypothetical protein
VTWVTRSPIQCRSVTSDQVEGRLVELLDQAGVNRSSPCSDDLRRAWDAMRVLAAERPVDIAPDELSDLLLAEYGTYDWGEGEHFELGITRQFGFEEDGEYSHMCQLHCTFLFEPTDELRALDRGTLWSTGSIEEFFEGALALKGFSSPAVTESAPLRLEVFYEEV